MQNIAGIHVDLDIPKWLRILHLDKINLYAGKLATLFSFSFSPCSLLMQVPSFTFYVYEKQIIVMLIIEKAKENKDKGLFENKIP